MDDVYRRIRSYELAFIEVVSQIDREHIIAGVVSIGEGVFDDITREERDIRRGAIELLRRALDRYDRPEEGMRWRE
jgi:hypothetical protein